MFVLHASLESKTPRTLSYGGCPTLAHPFWGVFDAHEYAHLLPRPTSVSEVHTVYANVGTPRSQVYVLSNDARSTKRDFLTPEWDTPLTKRT